MLAPDSLPDSDLVPATSFDAASIREGLPEPDRFHMTDLRCSGRRLGWVP